MLIRFEQDKLKIMRVGEIPALFFQVTNIVNYRQTKGTVNYSETVVSHGYATDYEESPQYREYDRALLPFP